MARVLEHQMSAVDEATTVLGRHGCSTQQIESSLIAIGACLGSLPYPYHSLTLILWGERPGWPQSLQRYTGALDRDRLRLTERAVLTRAEGSERSLEVAVGEREGSEMSKVVAAM